MPYTGVRKVLSGTLLSECACRRAFMLIYAVTVCCSGNALQRRPSACVSGHEASALPRLQMQPVRLAGCMLNCETQCADACAHLRRAACWWARPVPARPCWVRIPCASLPMRRKQQRALRCRACPFLMRAKRNCNCVVSSWAVASGPVVGLLCLCASCKGALEVSVGVCLGLRQVAVGMYVYCAILRVSRTWM